MRADDILDAIGHVDEVYVRRAKEKRRYRKAVWITAGSLAACLLLAVLLPGVVTHFAGSSGGDLPGDEPTHDVEIVPAYDDIWIYYAQDGQMARAEEYCTLQPSSVFALWKEKNGIGDEVELIECRIDGDSATATVEDNGEDTVSHEVGNHFILNVTVSKNIEAYYQPIGRELLLESLKQTMTGYSGLVFDACNIYFA